MNKLKGEVAFEAGGESYRMVYSINALCVLEDRMGKPVQEIGALLGGAVGMADLRAIFWAGLVEYQPNLTETEAGSLMARLDSGLQSAVELIREAFAAAFGPAKSAEGKVVRPPRPARKQDG